MSDTIFCLPPACHEKLKNERKGIAMKVLIHISKITQDLKQVYPGEEKDMHFSILHYVCYL